MNLSQAIKTLVEAKGLSILTSPLLLNILNDYNAFNEYPSSKNILKNIIEGGYLEKIAFFYDNQLPIGDCPQNYLSELYHKFGLRGDVTTFVLNSILQALDLETIALLPEDESNFIAGKKQTTAIKESDESNNHIKFHGISLSLTREIICDELEKKGYIVTERTSKLIELSGSFIDIEDVVIRLFGRPNGLVDDISVSIEHSLFCLYQINEEHIISLLTKKYGNPDRAIRNYYDCDEFDGMLLFNIIDDSNPETLDYMWSIPGGKIKVSNISGTLRIDYMDVLNMNVNQKETEKMYLDSI